MGAFALVGSYVFPAVFLTLATSGTALNLTPGRVMGVITRCGPGYVATVGLYLAAIVTYGLAVTGSLGWLVGFLGRDLGTGILGTAWLAHLTLIVAVYLMHLFCWRVGLLYRAHHEEFPWAFQYHVRTPRHGTPAAAKPAAAKTAALPQSRERAGPTNATPAGPAQQRQAQADALQSMLKYQRP
jgi:hypothetical protein